MTLCVTISVEKPDLNCAFEPDHARELSLITPRPAQMRRTTQLRPFFRRPKPTQYRNYHASVLPSLISPTSPEFVAKAQSMQEVISSLDAKLSKARLGGGQKSIDRMRSKGKKLPRERLSLLLDHASPFLELSPLAADSVYETDIPGAGIITGVLHTCSMH